MAGRSMQSIRAASYQGGKAPGWQGCFACHLGPWVGVPLGFGKQGPALGKCRRLPACLPVGGSLLGPAGNWTDCKQRMQTCEARLPLSLFCFPPPLSQRPDPENLQDTKALLPPALTARSWEPECTLVALAYSHTIELCRTRPAFERFASLSIADAQSGRVGRGRLVGQRGLGSVRYVPVAVAVLG